MMISNLQTEQVSVIQEAKPRKRGWVWLVGGCTGLICILLGIFAYWIFSFSKETYPLRGKVAFPAAVQKGDDFSLVITLINSTPKPIFIKHIVLHQDLDAPYLLDGATVMSVEPAMEAEPFAAGNDVQYLYFREIKPGETQTVVFRLRAESPGTYYANVGVYAKDPLLPDPAFIHAFHYIDAQIEITP